MKQNAVSQELPKIELENTQLRGTIYTCTIIAFVDERKHTFLYAYMKPWEHLITLTAVKSKEWNSQCPFFDVHQAMEQGPLNAGIRKSFRLQKLQGAPARLWVLREMKQVTGAEAGESQESSCSYGRQLSAVIPKYILQSKSEKPSVTFLFCTQTPKWNGEGMVGRNYDV